MVFRRQNFSKNAPLSPGEELPDLDLPPAIEAAHQKISAPRTLGAILRQARIAHNLEQKDVASQLKLGVNIIKGIEEDAFDQLGAAVFVRHYLKRYAELLGLPPEKIIARYQALGIDHPPPLKVNHPVKPKSHIGDLRWLFYPLVILLIFWLSWLGFNRLGAIDLPGLSSNNTPTDQGNALLLPGQNTTPTPTQPANLTSANPPTTTDRTLAPEALVNGQNPADDAPADRSTDQPSAATDIIPGTNTAIDSELPLPANSDPIDERNDAAADVVTGAAEVSATSAINTAADPTDATPSNAAPVADATRSPIDTTADATEQALNLVMKFSADCWVDVKDGNGKRLLYGTIKANESRTLTAPGPFAIVLGNATAAELILNGKPVAKSIYSKPGGVSRFNLQAPTR